MIHVDNKLKRSLCQSLIDAPQTPPSFKTNDTCKSPSHSEQSSQRPSHIASQRLQRITALLFTEMTLALRHISLFSRITPLAKTSRTRLWTKRMRYGFATRMLASSRDAAHTRRFMGLFQCEISRIKIGSLLVQSQLGANIRVAKLGD